MSDSTWVSVHAFHHGDLDVLLLDGVRPVVADLMRRGLVDSFFFLRYWDGGPHLRVRVLPAQSTVDTRRVEAELLAGLRGYLAEHPAPDSPELHRYPAAAAELATLERLDAFLPEPLPNNSAHAIAYRPETDRYGSGAALTAVERHFAESSRIALGLIAAGATAEQRHTAALAALLLTWLAQPPARTPAGDAADTPLGDDRNAQHGRPERPTRATGMPDTRGWDDAGAEAPAGDTGGASGRGGGAADLAWWSVDPGFEEGYLRDAAALHALAGQVAAIAGGTSTLPATGALTRWWRSIGTVTDPGAADSCAHLLCNRLGVTLPAERHLRHLAGRLMADVLSPLEVRP